MRTSRLLKQCLKGNHEAWEEFAKRYGKLLEFSAKNRLEQFGIRVDSLQLEEIVQEILVHLWQGRKLEQVRDEERITAWLAAVAANRAIDCWRQRNREVDRRSVSISENLAPGEKEELFLEATLVAEGPSPREENETREQHQRLRQALSQLSSREQLILKAAYFSNQTHEEIGQMLDIPRNTVSSIIERAHKKLQILLQEKPVSERLIQ